MCQVVTDYDLDAAEDTVFRGCNSLPSTEDETGSLDTDDSSETDWYKKERLRQGKTLAKGALGLGLRSLLLLIVGYDQLEGQHDTPDPYVSIELSQGQHQSKCPARGMLLQAEAPPG